jgi:hypothetical protein
MKRMFLLLVLTMIFCSLVIPSYAEDKTLEIKDGVIHFPEKDFQTVALSKLRLSFPSDCPQELLNIKGKIFRGELIKSTPRMTYTNLSYLIPIAYNSDTKEMTVYIVLEKGYGKQYEIKPVQGWLKGLFDLQNGSVLKWVLSPGVNIMTQDYRLHFLKNENLRINRSDGFSADYSPVGHLP